MSTEQTEDLEDLIEQARQNLQSDLQREFTVVFYAAGDEEMNEMHEFYCQAISEEDAEEQCLAANPGCTTTHIEESE